MSMASLLRHHGVTVPRYVTVNGQIVFDNVTSTADGNVHNTFGPVTKVADHTFHGGFEPSAAPVGELNDSTHLERHIDAVAQAFPHFEYHEPAEGHGASWSGLINTGRGRFKLTIALRRDGSLPAAIVTNAHLGASIRGRWVPAPHLFMNGNLCIADQDDWVPSIHTAATAIAWSAHWLAAYTEWRMARVWPVEGSHPVAP
jgi:hypothetical protein